MTRQRINICHVAGCETRASLKMLREKRNSEVQHSRGNGFVAVVKHLVRQNPVAHHSTRERVVFVVQIIVGGWIIQHAHQQLGQPERKRGRKGTNDKASGGVSSVCQLSALDSGV